MKIKVCSMRSVFVVGILYVFSGHVGCLQAQSFSLSSRPGIGTVLSGGSTVYTPIVQGIDGFSGTTQLSVSGLPSGATASFAPSSVTGSWAVSILTVSTSSTTPAGTYNLTIAGASGGSIQTTPIQLEVKAGITFNHPGVLISTSQLDQMSSNVNADLEPWQTAFANTSTNKLGSLTYVPTPQASVDTANSTQTQALITDSQAAYTQALLWYITKNPTYANNAIQIMNAWSSTFTGGITGSNNVNVISWTGENWPRAAEIIRYTYLNPDGTSVWASSDISTFKNWLTTQFLPLITPGRPYGNYGGNLDSASAEAAINIGVFNDDATTFLRGIWMWRNTLPAYLYMTSDGPNPAPPINWTAKNSSAANIASLWYNQSPLVDGLSQETCRDLGHVRWGFAALANGAETAYLQNVDLYSETTLGTVNSNRMQAALEFNATYLNGAVPPSWLCSGTLSQGSSVATGEVAYNHLVNRLGLSLPNLNTYLSANRPTGASYFMNWETLTHFDNPTVGTPGTVQLITTATLSTLSNGGYQAVVTVTNNGTGTAQHVVISTAQLGAASGTPAPISLGNLAPAGGSGVVSITFPSTAGAPGAAAAEKYKGSYFGGSFGGSIRATLP